MRGHLTEKADVYAFGVLALEIISGRLNSDPSLEEEKVYLLEWVWLIFASFAYTLYCNPSSHKMYVFYLL